jgi:hypothetical protein
VHGVGVGVAVDVGVGVGPDCAQYRPPVFVRSPGSSPPHTIISVPVQVAVWATRRLGEPVVLVAVQLLVSGLYLPPVAKNWEELLIPPQMII